MNRTCFSPTGALLACMLVLPASSAPAADDANALMGELSQQVRQHGEKLARCVDNSAARHAQNVANPPETAAVASVEDCEGVLRVFIASCSQNIQALCETFAKEMRRRETMRAKELIARLRTEKK
jgi:hypothetical protein